MILAGKKFGGNKVEHQLAQVFKPFNISKADIMEWQSSNVVIGDHNCHILHILQCKTFPLMFSQAKDL